jgi:hypothetical protein
MRGLQSTADVVMLWLGGAGSASFNRCCLYIACILQRALVLTLWQAGDSSCCMTQLSLLYLSWG